MSFNVTVIIPVFNAQAFIEKAVTSAYEQPEVKEIIVIEDGSTDDTPKILEKLREEFKNLQVYTHPGGINHGRAASRNLGLFKASSNYIAFLDADDYYLKDRFKNDKKLFFETPEIDGVYNAIGAHFYRPARGDEEKRYGLTTLKYSVPAERLFYEMAPKGDAGWFSGDGLTVKISTFEKTGVFNEDLDVAEDADMWIRMALAANLIGGILEKPVSMRGIHENNVFHLYGKQLYNRNMAKMYDSLLAWAYVKRLDKEVLSFFWNQTYNYYRYFPDKIKSNTGMNLKEWLMYGLRYPGLWKNHNYLYSLTVFKIYKKAKKRLL
jgi:glycosyltransferase involved in cell wall biosynthesis